MRILFIIALSTVLSAQTIEDPCRNEIVDAKYYADNSVGSVNRLELYYRDTLTSEQMPDSFELYWPIRDLDHRVCLKKDAIVKDSADAKHVTLTIYPPLASGFTRIIGSAELGKSYWKNPNLSLEAPVCVEQFSIADGVGPLINSAILMERFKAGDDTIILTFTENVNPDLVCGVSLLLKTPGADTATPLVVKAGLPGGSSATVKVVTSEVSSLKWGDSLSIMPTGQIVDSQGNHAFSGNRFVAITLQPIPAEIKDAVYLDRNADGNVDAVHITFTKKIDPAKTAIQLKWDGIKQVEPSFQGSSLTMVDTETVELTINEDTFGYKEMLHKTSGKIEITAIFFAFIIDNIRYGIARDGAAPAIQELQYWYGCLIRPERGGVQYLPDTLCVKYTEKLAANFPRSDGKIPVMYNYIDSITGTIRVAPIICIPSEETIYLNGFYRFIVDSSTRLSLPVDSGWLNVDGAGNEIMDSSGNVQRNPANRRVTFSIYRSPLVEPGIDENNDASYPSNCGGCGTGSALAFIPPLFFYTKKCLRKKIKK